MPLEEVRHRPGILINKNTKGWAHPASHFSTKTLALRFPPSGAFAPARLLFYF
jgi:hypothetical protein